jgi:phage shock protein A
MGLFDRITRVIKSNLNAAVSAAEDPEKILDQTVNDMQEDMVQLRQAIAQAMAAQKRLEQQYNQNNSQATEWEQRAKLALQKGEENLAREALTRKKTFTETALSLKGQIDTSRTQVETLKRSMMALESKIAEAKTKKDMLIARARAAKASEQINKAVGRVDTSSAMGAFDRMEDKVLQLEARSEAIAELAGDNLESQFASLEAGDVDEDLMRLKAELDNKNVPLPPAEPQIALPPPTTTAIPVSDDPVDAEFEALKRKLEDS